MNRYDLPSIQMSVSAQTVSKVLMGNLNVLDILIRESVQNSMDAGDIDQKVPVSFHLEVVKYNNHDFLEVLNTNQQKFNSVKKRASKYSPHILLLSDKGTTGLSGPVKKEAFGNSQERRNFYNLVYELGRTHNNDMAAGSYGFGKTVYYKCSGPGIVMYYSRCDEGERLAFCMISTEEEKQTTDSTGIAWWGTTSTYQENTYAAPLTDKSKIKDVLRTMKLEHILLDQGEKGTVIGIICPDWKSIVEREEDNSGDVVQMFKDAAKKTFLKWFWPRMTETEEVTVNSFIKPLKVLIEGDELKTDRLKLKSELLIWAEKIKNGKLNGIPEDIQYKVISHSTGDVNLGVVVYKILPFSGIKTEEPEGIAMIRAPRMVVFENQFRNPVEKTVLAIFLLNSKEKVYPDITARNEQVNHLYLDTVFKNCESATHSEWKHENIGADKPWYRTYVKATVTKTRELIEEMLNENRDETVSTGSYSPFAKMMGEVLQVYRDNTETTITTITTSTNGIITGDRRRITKMVISERKYSETDVTIKMKISNCQKYGHYIIDILASGGRDKYNVKKWADTFNVPFPFKLKSVTPSMVGCVVEEEKSIEENSIRFMCTEKKNELDLTIVIEVINKDMLIEFTLKNEK